MKEEVEGVEEVEGEEEEGDQRDSQWEGEEEGDQRDSQWEGEEEGEEEGTPSPPLWVQLAQSAKTLSENRRWTRHINSLSMQPTILAVTCSLLSCATHLRSGETRGPLE